MNILKNYVDMIMHSQIIGKGLPFIILHGFLGMGDNWKTLGRKFSELGYQVHLVDQRNHGRSFKSETFNYSVMAEDIKAYCKHHQIRELILLGHSMGGKTAMEFAATYPSMISKLIIVDIAPKAYPPHHQDILKALSSLDFSIINSREEADETLSEYIKEKGVRQFLLKNLYWKEKGLLGLRANLPILSKNISEIGKPLPEKSIYPGETLFLRGEHSGYIEPMDEITIKNHFPKAVLKTIPNAGHWVHAENPRDFYHNIKNFV
jgi:esterase